MALSSLWDHPWVGDGTLPVTVRMLGQRERRRGSVLVGVGVLGCFASLGRWDGLIFALVILVATGLLVRMGVVVADDGIVVRDWFWNRSIAWSEIEEVFRGHRGAAEGVTEIVWTLRLRSGRKVHLPIGVPPWGVDPSSFEQGPSSPPPPATHAQWAADVLRTACDRHGVTFDPERDGAAVPGETTRRIPDGRVVKPIAAALLVALVWTLAGSGIDRIFGDDDGPPAGVDIATLGERDAYNACQREVTSQVGAPAGTARFPDLFNHDDEIVITGSGSTITIRSHVEAWSDTESGMVRTDWTCRATKTSDGWSGSATLL